MTALVIAMACLVALVLIDRITRADTTSGRDQDEANLPD